MDHTTRLENVEAIRRWAMSEKTKDLADEITPMSVSDAHKTRGFHPKHRPSMLLLCLLDDGGQSGEWIRIRQKRVVIGRGEGEILISHDDAVSGKHVAVERGTSRDPNAWVVTDLKSTNGTFARIANATLPAGQEFLIGSQRFRFESVEEMQDNALSGAAELHVKSTRPWDAVGAIKDDTRPALFALSDNGKPERRIALDPNGQVIGSDPSVAQIIVDDPFVSPRHARIVSDKGRWWIANEKSLNGTWLRINKIVVDRLSEFQIGEQRFLVRVPGVETATAS
jgi:pSer/pThr/pTyr-binding forkhead associated (FHA) protein